MTVPAFTVGALVFILFALSRAVLRFRDGSMSSGELTFWSLFWIAAGFVMLWPGQTDRLATFLGIERGADVIIYASVILVYYLVFRIYIRINALSHEITRLVRSLALDKEASEPSK